MNIFFFFEIKQVSLILAHFVEPTTIFPLEIFEEQQCLTKQFFPIFLHLQIIFFVSQETTLFDEAFIFFQAFNLKLYLNLKQFFLLHFFPFFVLHFFLILTGYIFLPLLHFLLTILPPLVNNLQQITLLYPFLNVFVLHFFFDDERAMRPVCSTSLGYYFSFI